MRRSALRTLVLLIGIVARVHAQDRPMTAADSVFMRARLLVAGGNGAAGRVLVDSMLTVAAPDTPAYGEALYWRAALAATSADAETDFRRVIVEYPLSPRSGDALLQLAHLEVARGDRDAAITHLSRFLLENPKSPERPQSALLLVRLSFEANQPQAGCALLARVLNEVPDSDVELRNQLGYYTPKCATVDTTKAVELAPPPIDSAAVRRDSVRADSVRKASYKYTLQVAAYTTRSEADRLAKRLKDRGLEARVVGSTKLFRVRIGRYPTRAAATAAQKELKAKKIDAFVTTSGPADK